MATNYEEIWSGRDGETQRQSNESRIEVYILLLPQIDQIYILFTLLKIIQTNV